MLYSRKAEVESAPMQEETVIYDPVTRKFCMLNETAAFIWDLLENPKTADEISARICDNFDGVKPTDADRDVRVTLNELVELEMVMAEQDAAALGK